MYRQPLQSEEVRANIHRISAVSRYSCICAVHSNDVKHDYSRSHLALAPFTETNVWTVSAPRPHPSRSHLAPTPGTCSHFSLYTRSIISLHGYMTNCSTRKMRPTATATASPSNMGARWHIPFFAQRAA
eukprot:7383562-Prymnesium_polylepis.2